MLMKVGVCPQSVGALVMGVREREGVGRTLPLVAALGPHVCHEAGNRLTFAAGLHSARSVRLTKSLHEPLPHSKLRGSLGGASG